MPDRPLRVALLNDYQIVVDGLARMFEPFASRVVVVELAAGHPSVVSADVALYDSFSQTRGIARPLDGVLSETRSRRLAVYSWNVEPRLVADALKQGASGYLAKSLSAAELVDALEQIVAGEIVVPAPGAEGGDGTGDWPGRRVGLTTREAEIIALITQGLSNQEIAERAFLSINSVKSYIRSSYRKMGVDSRSRAVLWGIANGLRPDHDRDHDRGRRMVVASPPIRVDQGR